MKRFLTITLLFLTYLGFGQNSWIASEEGNAFDGFKKIAYTSDLEDNGFLLVIMNDGSTVFLDESKAGEQENDYDNLQLIFANINNSLDIESVMISFDNEKSYYHVDFMAFKELGYSVILNYGVRDDYNLFICKFKIIDLLKTKSKLNVRLKLPSYSKDFSFSLNGSAQAIDKVVKYANLPKVSWQSNGSLIMLLRYSALWKELNNWKIMENCTSYLEALLGKEFYGAIENIEFDEGNRAIVFRNRFLDEEIRISEEIWGKGAFDENGKLLPKPSD